MTESWELEHTREGEIYLVSNGRRIAKIVLPPPEDELVANVLLNGMMALTTLADSIK